MILHSRNKNKTKHKSGKIPKSYYLYRNMLYTITDSQKKCNREKIVTTTTRSYTSLAVNVLSRYNCIIHFTGSFLTTCFGFSKPHLRRRGNRPKYNHAYKRKLKEAASGEKGLSEWPLLCSVYGNGVHRKPGAIRAAD